MSIAEFQNTEETYEDLSLEEDTPERQANANILGRYLETRDQALFATLFERYQTSVSHYLLGKGVTSKVDRDDLSQDIFMTAFHKIDQLRDVRSFGGWLRAITRTTMINRRLRAKKHQHASLSPNHGKVEKEDADLEIVGQREELPLENLILEETRDKVQRALAYLKPLDAEMLRQFYVKGMSLKEMAEYNERPMGTIKRRLFTARKRIEVLLSHYMEAELDQSGFGISA